LGALNLAAACICSKEMRAGSASTMDYREAILRIWAATELFHQASSLTIQ
jgi:hypothetical protein